MSSVLKDVWNFRGFVRQAVIRDLKIRYKRSYLGVLWSVLNPLLLMTVLAIAFGLFMRFNIPYYPLFLFSGLVVWQFCQTTAVECLDQLVGSSNVAIYTKVNVPKTIFPLAHTTSQFINLLCGLGALFLLYPVYGFFPGLAIVYVVPALLIIYIFGVGLGMITAALNVFFRDMKYLIPVTFTALFYLSPVIYDLSLVPDQYVAWIKLNPFYYFIELGRYPLYHGTVAPLHIWSVASSVAGATLTSGIILYSKLEDRIAYFV